MAKGDNPLSVSKQQALPIDLLRRLVVYNPEDGSFVSGQTRGRCGRWKAGRPLGWINGLGYHCLSLNGRFYAGHRIAWFYQTEQWPVEVDHINGKRDDNRFINLRAGSHQENTFNHPGHKGSASGLRGVEPCNGRWRARMSLDGKTIHIGMFDTKEDAYAAFLVRAEQLCGPFVRGMV